MKNDKSAYSPIYSNEIQYELNNLIFEYHDLRRRLNFNDITHEYFLQCGGEIKARTRAIHENETPQESIRDYSLEQRMIDQEVLESLLWDSTDVSMDDLDDCLEDLEELLINGECVDE